MTHDQGDDAGQRDPNDQNLPVDGRLARGSQLARQPMEQIAGAMQVQAELLKQMHERQRLLEEVVKDNRRHELVINSAQALNESFQGLQRVQERLADQLEENSGSSRSRFVIIALAILLLAGVGGFLTWRLVDSADAINTNLKVALDPRARGRERDQELQANLAKLEARIHDVEAADRAAFRDEIERLRKGLETITTERDQSRRERDTAREELGAAKATLGTAQGELADLKGKTTTLEKDNARLTAQGVADQKTIVQLNDIVASVKDGKGAAPPPKPPASDADTARKGVATPDPQTAAPSPPSAVPDAPPPAKADGEVPASSGEALVPFQPAQLEALNALLKAHRGSDRYELKKVEKAGQKKLWNVVMEVRSPDGTLTKTIEADSMAFWLGKTDVLDIEFETGSVTFHQGIGGKSTKSAFYNNRYVVVVLTSNGKDWLAANQPYIRAR